LWLARWLLLCTQSLSVRLPLLSASVHLLISREFFTFI